MTPLVNLVDALAMLWLVPLALGLVGVPAPVRRLWPWVASPGVVALWLPRGVGAALLAVPYLVLTVALAGLAVRRLRRFAAADVAVATGLAAPVIAASALVAERAGHRLLGFPLETLALTVPHLHYAGLVAALVAALVCRATGDSPLGRAAAWCVPAGTGIVLVGYFVGDAMELVGAAVLTAGMWLVAALTVTRIGPRAPRGVRMLFLTSSGMLVVTMLLALDWAAGHVFPVPHLSIGAMVATHGVLNAVGFAMCALLAWRRTETT
ncbi:YndJ family protein [Asanoa sp. WMMD1127]|uniref:YndJ family protein n=1 Tax=Asanoa sp. WMMD1127 TaxID=3016107 RepID=UPI0024163BA3|nr:YndJ family protein [Asanoa sp. WMMD1127]MDG4823831.1 YndJ family protein [Asanoa sp. WMMD1127]